MTNTHFGTWALKHLVINEDASGLICHCPDQSGRWFKVNVDESQAVPTPVSCSCGTSNCKHQAVVAAMYNRIYKVAPKVEAPVVVEAPKVVKARKPRTGLVRKVRNGGLVRVEQPAPVAKVIELPVEVTDISKKGNFGTRAFSLMR